MGVDSFLKDALKVPWELYNDDVRALYFGMFYSFFQGSFTESFTALGRLMKGSLGVLAEFANGSVRDV